MNILNVSSSPHIKSDVTTSKIMLDVIIALTPAFIASGIFFGLRAILITLSCVLACVVFEYIGNMIMKKEQTIGDLSAVVTGMLLAFNLPSTIPFWIAIIGSFIAIVIVKQLFGGIGQNFANPAITARVILVISFTAQMTKWVEPFSGSGVDAITTATPLNPEILAEQIPSIWHLFIGQVGGCLGETSALALIIGGIYLVIRRVILPIIPVVYIGTVVVFSMAMGVDPVFQMFAGGLMLGAIFMATDYSTSPLTPLGKIIFAFGCGVITFAIRQFGSYPEGVSFAILFMNILVPYIDKMSRFKALGGKAR